MNSTIPAGITLNNRYYTVAQLTNWTPDAEKRRLTQNELDTLSFCRQWLTGQQEFVVNTSGSTGKPKAIIISREQMIISAQATGKALALKRGDRSLICMPTKYIAGKMMLVRSFVLSLETVIIEASSDPLAPFSQAERFDFTAVVPLQLQTLLEGPTRYQAILNRMKAILVGGGPVSVALNQQLQSIRAPIYHTYGMTETVTHIALRRLNGAQQSEAFVPLEGVQIGHVGGCLTIQAPVTRNKRLYTNDLVDLRPDGSFVWLGRADNVINSGGVKVQVEKVERALQAIFLQLGDQDLSGRRFFVGPLSHPRLGQAVTLVMEGAPLDNKMEMMIRLGLRPQLEKYEIPRQFLYLPQLKETPTSKIDRPATLRLLEAQNGPHPQAASFPACGK